tara:strand:- start:3506 stop:4414 length:909 start_codon:yes stop_codon:yes gene_type:complete
MAFLDNSGDIILDAVLTDTGRMRLAKGDGSFNITKFALGDDEINYALYNKNHASGSAYYDVEILQTPVLEAFTNNTSILKSKLLSISRTNLLYLPEIKQNTTAGLAANTTNSVITILVDQDTADTFDSGDNAIKSYYLASHQLQDITFDQGIVSNAIGDGTFIDLDADLWETQYIIEMDNRFGFLADRSGVQAVASFIDDDNIASYYLSTTTNSNFFGDSGRTMSGDVISGPRGSRLEFLIGASTDLASSTYLFTQLGGTTVAASSITTDTDGTYHLDTTIRITGATTGYRVDLPIRYVKNQ